MLNFKCEKIAVIGLGYVGLPLAVEFSKKYDVLGFDVDEERITALQDGHDETLELAREELLRAQNLKYSANSDDLKDIRIYIIAVPTPLDAHKRPDLNSLYQASALVGRYLKQGDIVIYESTVYPGATEEECVPILERESGLHFNIEFFCGYSPERINPGDKEHRLTTIKKVTSGSTPEIANIIDDLYSSIVTAGTYKASSIRIAEAAKVIENTQRDLNIALINELAMIFNKMDIDTEDVLRAAATKWNFINFRPGFVGGHCIGVDPYYLTHKAQALGYNPQLILAGRRINDEMGVYAANMLIRAMIKKSININNSCVLVMGLTFKENCPDLRNTRVITMINELRCLNITVDVYDPWVSPQEAYDYFGIKVCELPQKKNYDGVVMAVAHREFTNMNAAEVREFGKCPHVFFDVKSVFERNESDLRL